MCPLHPWPSTAHCALSLVPRLSLWLPDPEHALCPQPPPLPSPRTQHQLLSLSRESASQSQPSCSGKTLSPPLRLSPLQFSTFIKAQVSEGQRPLPAWPGS